LDLNLVLERTHERRPLIVAYDRMVNAGYVGKNQQEVRRHIQELAAKGIPGPKSTPTVYPVVCRALTTDSAIEVYGDKTSGEAEYVLLVVTEDDVYVGVGSDHTDRRLEEIDIPRAKQICPNILSRTVWPLAEVEKHWDDLLLSATVVKDGKTIRYQEGRLGLLLNPAQLIDFVKQKIKGPLRNLVIFSGTMGMLTNDFVFAERFCAQLIDEKLGRRLELAYDIFPLSTLTVD
jgi:Protein of unknown function (DUF2848)